MAETTPKTTFTYAGNEYTIITSKEGLNFDCEQCKRHTAETILGERTLHLTINARGHDPNTRGYIHCGTTCNTLYSVMNIDKANKTITFGKIGSVKNGKHKFDKKL